MTEQTYEKYTRPTYWEWSIDNPINPDDDKGNYETIEDKHYAEYLSYCHHYQTLENFSAIISNIGRIKKISENKKFEWEDEEPTETYNITYDFDEWFSFLKDYTAEGYSFNGYEVPENFENDLIEYTSKLKDYANGFLLGPVGMYQGKSFGAETYKADTFDEIVEHMKEVHQNNQMVFLYEVSQKTKRLKEIVVYDVTLPQDLSTFYKVCYGVLND
jgi:hypothetical protein